MGSSRTYSSRASIAPMMWVLLALSFCELAVVHLLLSHWSRAAAVFASALTLPVIIWLVLSIGSFGARPSTMDDDILHLRAGRMKGVVIPIDRIAGVRATFDAAAVKRRATLNLAMVAWPNIFFDLDPPLQVRRRTIDAVAHRLDDPAAFLADLEALRGGR